jgi:hypothetical protein
VTVVLGLFAGPVQADVGGGSDGAGATSGQAQNCSLYATPAQFGLTCPSGGDAGRSALAVLAGDPVPNCWDDPLSPETLARFGLPADGTLYLQTCLSGLDPSRPMALQDSAQLNRSFVDLGPRPPSCPSPQPAVRSGHCRLTLTARQRALVEELDAQDAQIPGQVTGTWPSATVRVNEPVAVRNLDSSGAPAPASTDTIEAGGVTMWAQRTGFAIYPQGAGGPRQACDGTAALAPGDSPATVPTACWLTYLHSSAARSGGSFPLRTESDWTVYVRDRSGTRAFADFAEFNDIGVAVAEIQTIVVGS